MEVASLKYDGDVRFHLENCRTLKSTTKKQRYCFIEVVMVPKAPTTPVAPKENAQVLLVSTRFMLCCDADMREKLRVC